MKLGGLMNQAVNIIIILLVTSIISCNDEINKKNNGDNTSDTINYALENIFEDFEQKKVSISKFHDICSKQNLMSNYNIDYVVLDGIRGNYYKSYLHRDGVGTDGFFLTNRHLFGYIYDNSSKAFHKDYGYIISNEKMLLNKTENNLYYIRWDNDISKLKSPYFEYTFNNKIDSTTKDIYTNIDSNLIRRVYNYSGRINRVKIDSLILKMNQYDEKLEFDSLIVSFQDKTN
ncbi:MAG: hypothetical protein WC121_00600 [Candidatus Kapaibacterium sp.]